MSEAVTAFVDWPHAPLTKSLVEQALNSLLRSFNIQSLLVPQDFTANPTTKKLVQWATYDSIDHELTAQARHSVLSSSYIFRKALIRKHFLSRMIHSYVTKHPGSLLARAVPRTWEMELAFADEVDEMWTDELFDLAEFLEGHIDSQPRWCILKPGMADRGMGIRLFDSKEGLQSIFEEFERSEDAEDEYDSSDTVVIVSQLRHFVVQVRPLNVRNPTLFSRETGIPGEPPPTRPGAKCWKVYRQSPGIQGEIIPPAPCTFVWADPSCAKFHLRVYCVASGALKVYLYTRILALFSPVPFVLPEAGDSNPSLTPHLTNTSLQTDRGEAGVRLLDELVGCQILSPGWDRKLKEEDTNDLIAQIREILSETFKAALENPVHFQVTLSIPPDSLSLRWLNLQPLPNAFELFGVDFLVTCEDSKLQPYLLEINSEPAIELTGPRLKWVLEDLFRGIARLAVEPHLPGGENLGRGEALGREVHFLKCLDVEVRGEKGW